MPRRWWVLAAVTLIFFFLNGATFTSLGVALYSMIAELHWSQTAAGFGFALLGIACGLSSPLPAVLMKRIGTRWTIVLGCVTLALGFLLASVTHSLLSFYIAMLLLGTGYSLAGNVPGIYVVASWFPQRAPRMIGFYLMGGALGSVVGPPVVQGIVAASGSWRVHWLVMALAGVVIGAICLFCVREVAPLTDTGPALTDDGSVPTAVAALGNNMSYREAIKTPQFRLVAASMTLSMATLTTIDSVAVTHLTHRAGSTPAFAALALSIAALATTVAKGIAGPLCEYLPPRILLAAGLGIQALGVALFAGADSSFTIYAFAVAFGCGLGLSYLAANVLLLEYFGCDLGSRILAFVWLVTTLAAAGPLIAGMIADQFGTFAPIFYVYTVLLLLVAIPVAVLGKPVTLLENETRA
jgi:MFS family permease